MRMPARVDPRPGLSALGQAARYPPLPADASFPHPLPWQAARSGGRHWRGSVLRPPDHPPPTGLARGGPGESPGSHMGGQEAGKMGIPVLGGDRAWHGAGGGGCRQPKACAAWRKWSLGAAEPPADTTLGRKGRAGDDTLSRWPQPRILMSSNWIQLTPGRHRCQLTPPQLATADTAPACAAPSPRQPCTLRLPRGGEGSGAKLVPPSAVWPWISHSASLSLASHLSLRDRRLSAGLGRGTVRFCRDRSHGHSSGGVTVPGAARPVSVRVWARCVPTLPFSAKPGPCCPPPPPCRSSQGA